MTGTLPRSGDRNRSGDPDRSGDSDLVWYDASPAQQGIWVLDRVERLRPTYLLPSVVALRGTLDHAAFVAAVTQTVARHPSLRSRFRLDAARRQVVYRTDGPAAEVGFLDAAADGWSPAEVERLIGILVDTPLDLAEGPPVRAELIRVDAESAVFVLTGHHICLDGWSRNLVMEEIAERYRAAVGGPPADLAEPPHPDAVARRSTPEEVAEQVRSVVERLTGAPVDVELPFPRRTGSESLAGATVSDAWSGELSAGVRRAAADAGCTLFMTAVALLAGTLARLGTQRDFLFAFAWPGRADPEAARVVGMLVNTAMLRVTVDPDTSWRELMLRARAGGLAAYVDGDAPLDAVSAALNPHRERVWPPLSPVLVNLDETPQALELGAGVVGEYRPLESFYVKYDLALFVRHDEASGQLELSLDFPVEVFPRERVGALLAALHRSASHLANSPESPVLESSAAVDLTDPVTCRDLVRAAWRDVLQADAVDDTVSFFDAGGDSLLLVVLVERLGQVTGRQLRTMDVFRAGTIRGQAALLADQADDRVGTSGPTTRDHLLQAARGPRA